ncbi:MAG: response regulator [Flavobacteriales bacterium]|tara:strand:- start:514 stop:867 length:354 start_codon:yes stop_codon:yes gene_type:complete
MSNEKTILIVEDEIQLLDTWKEMLLHFGYKPLMAENGMKAINILNEQKVDLIITDLKMPEYDGLFLLNFLKEKKLNIPTIVCSGQTEDLSDFDVAKVINKPLNMTLLISELDHFILN